MGEHDLLCRIWATEQNTQGFRHGCRSVLVGLDGHFYRKEEIEEVLKTRPTQGRGDTWYLVACEPDHDGSACKECKYSYGRGKSRNYRSPF